MSFSHLRLLIVPLLFREIALRVLLTSALVRLLVGAFSIAFVYSSSPRAIEWFFEIIIPLSIGLHHFLRVWPWRYWTVAFEALFSLVEAVASGYAILRSQFYSSAFRPAANEDPSSLLEETSAFFMGIFSLLASSFLLCDILSDCGRNFLFPYDFSAGLCQRGQQWNFIFGRFTRKKRFSTDNSFVRFVRGGLAILCLLAVSYLLIYTAIWRPFQWSGRPSIKTLEAPTLHGSVEGNMIFTMGELGLSPFQIKAILGGPDTKESKMNITLAYIFPGGYVTSCQQDFSEPGSVLASCHQSILPNIKGTINELLITVQLLNSTHEFPIYLGLTNSTNDVLNNAEPIVLRPGSNLHGVASVIIKERFLNQGAATLGLPQYRRICIFNVHSLSPDLSPSLPKGNTTTTLRVTILSQPNIKIEQEYLENSILSGFALVGGAWTLINGIFAAIFGTTLLLILFGIKPLSIYGLVHCFQGRRASLVDRDYDLPPEERDYIVGILREHLMDVDNEEEGRKSRPSPHYNPVDTTVP